MMLKASSCSLQHSKGGEKVIIGYSRILCIFTERGKTIQHPITHSSCRVMSVQPMAASGDTKCTIQAYFERQEAWDATFLLSALLSTSSSIQMRCPEKWAHGGVQTRARQVRLELTEAGQSLFYWYNMGKGWHGALRPLTQCSP